MQEPNRYKFKICLVGEKAVGKTSLIRRFVYDEFGDRYDKTIGTRITKKEFEFQNTNGELQEVTLLIWDIMGDKGFRKLFQESYFFKAQGIIGICDVTRRSTLPALYGWMNIAQSVAGEVPVVFLANKIDLLNEQELELENLQTLALKYDKSEAFLSSAKTGENVELAFRTLSENIICNSLCESKKSEVCPKCVGEASSDSGKIGETEEKG
jgi:small GTP-binding protein